MRFFFQRTAIVELWEGMTKPEPSEMV